VFAARDSLRFFVDGMNRLTFPHDRAIRELAVVAAIAADGVDIRNGKPEDVHSLPSVHLTKILSDRRQHP
jgi:hypothetical protein